jgi:signal transduction histidine kinase
MGLTLAYAIAGLTLTCFLLLFIWKARGRAPMVHKLLAVTILLNVVVGLYDLYVLRLSSSYEDQTYLRYVSILFGASLAFIVMTRLKVARAELRDLLGSLEHLVAKKEVELAQTYQRLEQLARGQERVAERTRILRDMHDGVGSCISTAIRQLESGRAAQGDVLQTLRDSLDQLKLSIDAMSIVRGDLTTLLANLRYRLSPRLRVSDLVLAWDVDQIEPLAWLDEKAMRHLQFMVYEAVSNVLQHAKATALRIELHSTPCGGVVLRVTDNGCGYEAEKVQRLGLSSLHERACAIQAKLDVVSVHGQTRVEIFLEGPVAG